MTQGWAALLLLMTAFAGCVGGGAPPGPAGTPADGGAETIPPENDSDGQPDYRPLPDPITKLTHVTFGDGPGGNGVWLWNNRGYLSTGRSNEGLVVFDLSNPEAPVRLGAVAGQYARDVDILNYGNRTVAVAAAGGPIVFYDVTDPAAIRELARFQITSHNIAVHRPGHVVYNSRSLGSPTGGVEIYDASDPDAIRLHKVWNFPNLAADGTPVANTGCHDVTVNPEIHRAYCAAITQTLEWDVTDPLNPRVLRTIDNPLINIHHSAFLMSDKKTLVIGDEYGGAILYACYGYVATPVKGVSTPTGAIWFYDMSLPVPLLLSWLSPPPIPNPPSTCTAHFGSELGATKMIAYGWYNSGTLLVDAKDPLNPRLVDKAKPGGSVWDARYYRGYVFTGDGKGLGVLRPE